MPRTKKERIFRHMAREVPECKIVFMDRYKLEDELGYALFSRVQETEIATFVEKALGNWVRWTRIKHGSDVKIKLFSDYDIDFNRYRMVGKLVLR